MENIAVAKFGNYLPGAEGLIVNAAILGEEGKKLLLAELLTSVTYADKQSVYF